MQNTVIKIQILWAEIIFKPLFYYINGYMLKFFSISDLNSFSFMCYMLLILKHHTSSSLSIFVYLNFHITKKKPQYINTY